MDKEETIKKINLGNLEELNETNLDYILEDKNIKELFFKKVKELKYIPSIIIEDDINLGFFLDILLKEEYLHIFLDSLKNNNYISFIESLYGNVIDEILQRNNTNLEELKEKLEKYKDDNRQEVINYLSHLEDSYLFIKDDKIMDYIITNKLYNLLGVIDLNSKNEYLNEFIVEALLNNGLQVEYGYFFDFKTEEIIKKVYSNSKEDLLNIIRNSMKDTNEKREELFLAITDLIPDLKEDVANMLFPEELLSIYSKIYIELNEVDYDFLKFIEDLFKKENIDFVNIPNNFPIEMFSLKNYEYLYKVLLKSCNKEQFEKIDINYQLNDEELINICLKKIVEFQIPYSEFHNNHIHRITEYFKKLSLDQNNPLQLNLDDYTRHLYELNNDNEKLLLNAIEKDETISTTAMMNLLNLFIYFNDEKISNIFSKALESDKFDKQEMYDNLIQELDKMKDIPSSNNNYLNNSLYLIDDIDSNKEVIIKKKLLKTIEPFIKKHNNVPLDLTKYFSSDIIKNNSLINASDEFFNNHLYFKTEDKEIIKLLYDEVINRLNNNRKVDYRILLNISNYIPVDYNYFNNENLVFNMDDMDILNYVKDIENPILFKKLSDAFSNKSIKLNHFITVMFIRSYIKLNDESLFKYAKNILNLSTSNWDLYVYLSNNIIKNEILKNLVIEYIKEKDEVPIFLTEKLGIDYVKQYTLTQKGNNYFESFSDGESYLSTNNKAVLNLLYEKIKERLNNNQKVDINYLFYLKSKNVKIDYNYFDNNNIIYNFNNDKKIKMFIKDRLSDTLLLEKIGNCLTKCNTLTDSILRLSDTSDIIKEKLIECIQNNKIKINHFNEYCFQSGILEKLIEKGYTKDLVDYLIHHNSILSEIKEKTLNNFIKGIITEYAIDENNFQKIKNIYGNNILLLFGNEKFLTLLNQSNENVDRFLDIIKIRKLNTTMIEAINDSLRQNIFAKENKDTIMNIYQNIIILLQNGISNEDKEKYISELANTIPSDFNIKNALINYYKSLDISKDDEEIIINSIDNDLINLFSKDKREFISKLFDLILVNQNIYSPYLNIITTKYIIEKRNQYASNNDIYNDTNIEYNYEQKKVDDYLFNYLLKNDYDYLIDILCAITKEREVLNYLKNPSNDISKDNLINMKSIINDLRRRFYENIKYYRKYDYLPSKYKFLEKTEEFKKSIKKIPLFPNRLLDLDSEISKIDIKVLFDNVINDEKKYNSLQKIINKYRILDWDNLFNRSVSKLAIGTDDGLYTFINCFSKIYDSEIKIKQKNISKTAKIMMKKGYSKEEIEKYIEEEKNKELEFNAFKILKYCSTYSGYANYYKIILGIEDFELIKANPKPYSGDGTSEDRLLKCVKLQIENIQNNDITIPSSIEDISVKDNKSLRVIIGNRASSFNLTHGERTGACMRAYGIADNTSNRYKESMFEKMHKDSRCFHITFQDPKTGEYVSRVSGFRNGNTIFLNQLRHSVSSNYTDEEVIEACKEAANIIIENSNESEMPIENVVVSPSEALFGYETQHLSETDIGKGVFYGYKDVTNNAVVLATTGQNGKAKDVILNPEQPHYKCVRMPVKEYTQEDMDYNKHIEIQRIRVLKECVEHKEEENYYERCDIDLLELETEYIYVILGQDFVVTLDNNYEIRFDIIDGDERATLEMKEAIEKIELIKNKYTEGLGGKSNDKVYYRYNGRRNCRLFHRSAAGCRQEG